MFTVMLIMEDLDLDTPEQAVRAFWEAACALPLQYVVTDDTGKITYVDFDPEDAV